MRIRLLLALGLLAPVATAQVTEAQAVKSARAAAKAALKDFKTTLDTHRKGFLGDVGEVEAKFMAGQAAMPDLIGLFDRAFAMQMSVQNSIEVVEDVLADGVQQALADFAGGKDLKNNYPAQLQLGTSGVLDDANAAIDKLLAKTYAAIGKRLLKTEAIVAASSPLRLRSSLRPPYGSLPVAASEKASMKFTAGLGIDLIWAVREALLSVQGNVLLSGTNTAGQFPEGPDVSVIHVGQEVGAPIAVQAEPFFLYNTRWSAEIDGLDHGSWLCLVTTHGATDAPYCAASFGLP